MSDIFAAPHRRYNPLTGEWLLVSPHRATRPWQGQIDPVPPETRAAYDPQCYLCPGNVRANGERNPDYAATFVFRNDFSALLPDVPAARFEEGGLLRAESEAGICRVMCFSPRHDLTLAKMAVANIRKVVDMWADQTTELSALPWISYVQIFENRGAQMGASNPHPHGQLWANATLPTIPAAELRTQTDYLAANSHCMLCEYREIEERAEARIVVRNDEWLAIVPFWAVWPFEVLLLPRTHVASIPELSDGARDGLTDLLSRLLIRYDHLFEMSFPYSMGWHQAPTDPATHPQWHLHGHIYPPLLRSATVRKWMVGYEMLAQSQRDITAEQAAERLRALPETHEDE
jgi:UDPglucose--hexose-1-phosphate uridylyltransferase